MNYKKYFSILAIACFNLFMCDNLLAQNSPLEQTLSIRQQHIVTIASYTGRGDLLHLKIALGEGLDAGLTVNEIKEILVHSYAYCGFPRSLRGLQTFIAVLDERKAKGINDKIGREASPITDQRSKYERGRDILAEISGVPANAPKAGYAEFAPIIEQFLKEHHVVLKACVLCELKMVDKILIYPDHLEVVKKQGKCIIAAETLDMLF